MSDKKTDIDTDFEEKRADIANKKWRTRTNNDIYDRFISRVQSTESDCRATGNIKKRGKVLDITATETADTETVFDFSNSNSLVEETFNIDESSEIDSNDSHLDSDPNSIMDSEAEMQSDTKATTYNDDWATQEAQIQEVISEPATAQNKLASSKKPLIIGMFFGSLLIAVIVTVLIFTGVLSTSTNTTMPDSASSTPNNNETIETAVTTNSIPVEDTESETSIDESKPEVEPSATDMPVATVQQGETTSESQNSTTNDAEATEAPLSEAASNESQADTTISYEVFRQESQNTVYRETND